MKKLLVIAALGLSAYAIFVLNPNVLHQFSVPPFKPPSNQNLIEQAFKNGQSNVQVQGEGVVVAILPDDNQGRRHQRFVIRLASGQTLLMAHNIDLAPLIDSLAKGDTIEFYGEYEWSEKGGVIHRTHHDPDGRHADGWIVHRGRRYNGSVPSHKWHLWARSSVLALLEILAMARYAYVSTHRDVFNKAGSPA